MHCLRHALAMMVLLWLSLACGMDGDEQMVRRYAECMVDPNTTLYRLTVSGAVGDRGAERGGGEVACSTVARGDRDG